MPPYSLRTLLLATYLPLACLYAHAQAPSQSSFVSNADTTLSVSSGVSTSSSAVKPQTPLTARWLDLKTLSYSSRYRNTTNLHGRRLFQFGQERYVSAGRLKLDQQGKYTIDFQLSSGRYFNWSYADLIDGQYKDSVVAARTYKTAKESADLKLATKLDPNGAVYGAGIPSRGGYFSPRQLYFSATPISAITVEFGSLPIEHGQNTEITSFDDDGYIAGERVRVHDPKHLFFDQIAATWAYLGSPLTPNFFARGADLTRSNYSQYLVEKRFGKHVAVSTDYTGVNGTHTMREAIALKLPNARPMDAARLELYQRPNTVMLQSIPFAGGAGFAVSAHNTSLHQHLGFEAGYATIDNQYAVYGGSIYLATVGFAWNGDSYETGQRVFSRADLKLVRGLNAVGFYTHAVTPIVIGHNQQGWSSGIVLDLKTLANSGTQIF